MHRQEKEQAAQAHNKAYAKKSEAERKRPVRNIIKPANHSIRNIGLDHTSKHGSKAAGRKMRAKVDKTLGQIMSGRKKINALFARAKIRTAL